MRALFPEKPAGAWTAEQVAAFLLERLAAGDFYVLCPDNETPRELDVKRMAWNLGDITENRSALPLIRFSRRPLRRSWREAKLTLFAAVRKPSRLSGADKASPLKGVEGHGDRLVSQINDRLAVV